MDFNYLALTAQIVLVLSLWLTSKKIIWAACFLASLVFARLAGWVDEFGIIWVLAAGGLFWMGYRLELRWLSIGCLGAGFLIALTLGLGLLSGIGKWEIVSGFKLSPDSIPYNLGFRWSYISLPFWVFIGAPLQVSRAKNEWFSSLKKTFPLMLGALVFVTSAALVFGYVRFDFKIYDWYGLWIINNLFFVCFFEETFFRGFLQNHLQSWLPQNWYPKRSSLLIVSLLFGLAHLRGGYLYVILASGAGLFYGLSYQRTRCLESPILVHFVVNLVHLLFFSYPALQGSL